MVVVPLVSLLHVNDGVPGVHAHARTSVDGAQLVALERPATGAASRSRLAFLPPEDTGEPATTTTAAPPPPPPTTAVARVVPKPAPATTVRPKPKPAPPTTARAKPKPPPTTAAPTTTAKPANTEEGGASYYSPSDPAECAHRSLAFGTLVTVTNVANGKSTTCRVGDRGPFVGGRIIDLSRERFASIGSVSSGVMNVRISW